MKTPIRDQRGFLLLVGAVAAGRLALSWGHSPGSVQVGLTVLGLWAVGAVWAALIQSRQRPSRGGDLLGLLGVQNLAIQLLVVLPATLAGVVRLIRTSPEQGGMAFVSNAVVTVLVVPLLGALVMTFMALVVAVPVRTLLGSRAHRAGSRHGARL